MGRLEAAKAAAESELARALASSAAQRRRTAEVGG